MPVSTAEVASVVMSCKDGCFMASPRPFVVSSVSTKRYAPSKKDTVQTPPATPQPSSTKGRFLAPRVAPTKQTSLPSPLPSVNWKEEPCGLLANSIPFPSQNVSIRAQKLLPGPSNIPQRLKKGSNIMGGSTAVVTSNLTRVTAANEHAPQSSCIPRFRTYRSVSVAEAPWRKQDVTAKTSTTSRRDSTTSHQKPIIHINTSKVPGRDDVTATSSKKCVVVTERQNGRNRKVEVPKPIVYPQSAWSMPHPAWSPPPSPCLSSFPSQTWSIVIDAEQIKTPSTACSEETLFSIGDPFKSGVTKMPNDRSCRSGSIPSSPIFSSSSTVIGTSASSIRSKAGSDGIPEISSPMRGPSAEVSHTVCAATIVSPSDSPASSLAKMIDDRAPETGDKVSTTIQYAIEIARAFFSSSRPGSQSTSPKTVDANAPQTHQTFIPRPGRDAKAW